MRRFPLLAAASTALLLTVGSVGYAQSNQAPQQQTCQQGQKNCVQSGKSNAKASTEKAQTTSAKATTAPKAGGSAKGGAQVQRAKNNSKLKEPAKGQEYRVVNDQVVLADSKTLKIIRVVGPASTLLK